MNTTENFSFSREQFSTLMPYHICTDINGVIISCGTGIAAACELKTGFNLLEHFTCKKVHTNETVLDFDGAICSIEIVLWANNNPYVGFIGKFEPLPQSGNYLLVCYPYLYNNSRIPVYTPSQAQIAFLSHLKKVCTSHGLDVNWEKFSEQFMSNKYLTINTDIDEEYGITLSNAEGNVVWCNRTFERLTERQLSEIAGKRPRNSIYGRHSVYIDTNYVDNKIKNGEPFYFENIGTSKTGKEFWFGANVQPIFDNSNNITGRIHYLKDINNRKVKELEIDENENLLTLAVEAAKAGLWAYDLLTEDFKVSKEYKKILGFDVREELTFEMITAKIHPEDLAHLTNEIDPYLSADNPSFVFEHRVMVAGAYRYFNAKANCIRFTDGGRPTKLVGTLRDVTNERERVLEIERQKQFYHSILDNIPADIALFDAQHKYLYVNKTAVKNDELRNWIIGKDDQEYCEYRHLDPSVAQQRRAVFDKVTKQKATHKFVERKETETGEQYIKRVFYPTLNDKNEIDMVIGYAMDITEQVENEQYAQQQEKRMKTILDISSDGIFRCNADGEVTMCNDSFLKILNVKESDPLNIFRFISDDDRDKFKAHAATAIDTGDKQVGGFILKNKINGEHRYCDYNLTRTVISKSRSFSGRISDITEVVMKEKNMQKAIEDEMQLNKYKTQFIHISSHELRTPLTIIQANAEILQLCLGNPELQKKKDPNILTGRIIKEVEIMTEILNQLMMVSKIENGNIELDRQQTDIRQFIKSEVVNLYTPYTDGRFLTVNIADEIGSWNIDSKILRHALLNLLSNAFKYSYNKPAPVLDVTIEHGQLLFSVKDFGIGIPDTDQQKLFQSFFRASNVGVISGTGIGLMVVEYAVKKHNGSIDIQSEVNKGSIFTITLPE